MLACVKTHRFKAALERYTVLEKVNNGYLNFDWGQLHYRSVNLESDLPLLIMLHQSPLSSRNYQALLPHLSKRFRVMALDTPGFGQSEQPAEVWNVESYAKVAFLCADALGVDKFHLFGRATGAVFAFVASQMVPERLKRLVLHGMPVYTAEERRDRLANFAPPYEIDDDGSHLDWIWSRIQSEYPWIDGSLATHFCRDFLNAGPDFATSYRSIWQYDLPASFAAGGAKLACPTLLIGGGGDRINFMHERACSLLPEARQAFLETASDFVAEQEPAIFATLLADFLDGCVESE